MNPKTKTFRYGLGVKAPRYWKDNAHHYRIINECITICIYISFDKDFASIDRCGISDLHSMIFTSIFINGNNCNYCESTEKEFNQALELSLKIIKK